MNHKNQRGQSLVEFALVLPLLIIVVMGGIEFALLMFNQAVITNASREGARAGIVTTGPYHLTTEDEVKKVVVDYCKDYLISFDDVKFTGEKNVIIRKYKSDAKFGDPPLEVYVTYPYHFLVLPNFMNIANSLTLKSRTRMKWE